MRCVFQYFFHLLCNYSAIRQIIYIAIPDNILVAALVGSHFDTVAVLFRLNLGITLVGIAR